MNINHPSVSWAAALAVVLSASWILGADQEPGDNAVTDALIEVSRDPDPEVRLAAFAVLSKEKRSEAIAQALRRGLQDENNDVRQAALSGLIQQEGATDEILRLLVSGLNDPVTVRIARKSLVAFGEPAAPYLVEATKDDDTKRQAVQLLGQIKPGAQRAKVLAALIATLKDDSSVVRLEATRSLGNLMEAARRAPQIDPRYMDYFKKVYEKFDTNKDDVLTEDEWAGMSKNPQAADANGDGRITLEEYAKWSLTR